MKFEKIPVSLRRSCPYMQYEHNWGFRPRKNGRDHSILVAGFSMKYAKGRKSSIMNRVILAKWSAVFRSRLYPAFAQEYSRHGGLAQIIWGAVPPCFIAIRSLNEVESPDVRWLSSGKLRQILVYLNGENSHILAKILESSLD